MCRQCYRSNFWNKRTRAALAAAGLGAGDGVLLPPYTFMALVCHVSTKLIYCLVRKKSGETSGSAFERGAKRILERLLVGLAKILAILGVTLTTVAAIIWVFTSILVATGNFLVAMLSVYLLGGLAALAVTFIFNAGAKMQPAVATKSRMRTHWAIALMGAGIGTLGIALPSFLYGIESNEGYYSDSQILIIFTVTLGVLLLAVGLILGGAYLFQSRRHDVK